MKDPTLKIEVRDQTEYCCQTHAKTSRLVTNQLVQCHPALVASGMCFSTMSLDHRHVVLMSSTLRCLLHTREECFATLTPHPCVPLFACRPTSLMGASELKDPTYTRHT
jgi:hypothetical protein